MIDTTANTDRLVARVRGTLVELEQFPSYDAALAAQAAATQRLAEYPEVEEYAVRSIDDPHVIQRFATRRESLYDRKQVARAMSERNRVEVGATALAMINAAPVGRTIAKVEQLVRASLRARGFKPGGHDVERAVKSRVTIGRCDRHGGFWFKTSDGPLRSLACPTCGGRLHQSTLALRSGFQRIDLVAARECRATFGDPQGNGCRCTRERGHDGSHRGVVVTEATGAISVADRVRHAPSGREGVVLSIATDGYVEIRYDDNVLGRYTPETGALNPEGAQLRDLQKIEAAR